MATFRYWLFSMVLECGFSLGVGVNFESILFKFRSKLTVCDNQNAYFWYGQDYLLDGAFWLISRFNLLAGQTDLLDGQLHTQLFTSLIQARESHENRKCGTVVYNVHNSYSVAYTTPNSFDLSKFASKPFKVCIRMPLSI